jgi:hypothetical protein
MAEGSVLSKHIKVVTQSLDVRYLGRRAARAVKAALTSRAIRRQSASGG